MDITGSLIFALFEVLFDLFLSAVRHLFDLFMATFSKTHRTKLKKEWNDSFGSKIMITVCTLGSFSIIGFIFHLIMQIN